MNEINKSKYRKITELSCTDEQALFLILHFKSTILFFIDNIFLNSREFKRRDSGIFGIFSLWSKYTCSVLYFDRGLDFPVKLSPIRYYCIKFDNVDNTHSSSVVHY